MKIHSIALVVATAIAATVCLDKAATADTITYGMSSSIPANSSSQGIDITDGGKALDWMVFVGVNPAPSSNTGYSPSTMPVWDASPSGGAESITAPAAGAVWNQGSAGPFVQYSNGTDPFGDTALSFNTSDYVWNWGTPGTTFTQKLIQSTETLTMPVFGYTDTTIGLEILATLTNSGGTQTASIPATDIAESAMNAINSKQFTGILTINVAGAIGDTLSVSVAEPDGNSNSGIFSATVTAVPDPSTFAMLAVAVLGGLALAGRRRTGLR